jgi:hypothetical protein
MGLDDEGLIGIDIVALGEQLEVAVEEHPLGLGKGQPEGILAGLLGKGRECG